MRSRNFILLLFLCSTTPANAQTNSEKEDRSTFAIQLNQDNTFNFFPVVFGSIPLKRNDLTFYAIFWTTPIFANPDGTGSLIEAGMGVGFTKGNFYINPSLGFAHGIFTNGRDQDDQGRPTFGDAIVPGFTSFYKSKWGEAEFFCAIYQNLRKEIPPQANYLFLWLLPGIRFTNVISTGFHYEQFRDIKNGIGTYARYGLYAKVTFKKRYDLRLSGGLSYASTTTSEKEQGDFYKLTVFIPL
jgi:hypothetical protein